jgi:hypothetical protein
MVFTKAGWREAPVLRIYCRTTRFVGIGFVICAFLSGCSTALLNTNTLDLATTIDDLAIRQVVFNLAKIKDNKWAIPSQVQVSGGQVLARTNGTATITTPLNSAVTQTTQVASQVVAATRALTTTTTGVETANQTSNTAGVGGTVEATENWNVVPVQDPDQLRRLRLVYQYGAGQISAKDLLCWYPIPQIPAKAQTESKSDLQSLADALKAAQGKTDESKNQGKNTSQGQNKKRIYIRGEDPDSCVNVSGPERTVKWTSVGPNPDPAFLNPPGCVLCAYPNKKFNARFKRGETIYINRTSDETVEFDQKQKYEYVPVVVNDFLKSSPHKTGEIDWLFVVKNGEEVPAVLRQATYVRRVGSSSGYTVYTTDEQSFSELVLAVTEATLQSPEFQKSVVPPPPLVQTNPTR